MELDELKSEQRYFDGASDAREKMRTKTNAAPTAAAHPGAAKALRQSADRDLANLGGPNDAVAVGRFDKGDDGPIYVGRNGIFDDSGDALVVNWRAPVAAPYYEATANEPMGVVLRRQFTTDGNLVTNFDDTLFEQLFADLAGLATPHIDDALLRELDRSRTGEMHDIVQTIQAAQYAVIRAPFDQVLVVQGGPGTGKTIVALHRVSWLLYNHSDELRPSDVLVLGPNKTFTRYIRNVLPSLGDRDVTQTDITSLGLTVRRGREEPAAVVKLKGDVRMAELLRRAVRERVRIREDEGIEVPIGSRILRLEHGELSAQVDRWLELPYASGRTNLRSFLVSRAVDRLRVDEGDARQPIEQALERIWPQHTPQSFLQELLSSRERLLNAAGDEFTAREAGLLQRTSSRGVRDEVWSDSDAALLDELNALIGTEPIPTYRLIVIDEAQDLSPMQMRCVIRRSDGGSMTLLGDIAQSTGPWARDDWTDLLDQITNGGPRAVEELRFGYRVPREIFELAAQLLPIAAPGVTPPEIVRTVGAEPEFLEVDVDEVGAVAVSSAMSHSGRGLSVGIICPDSQRTALERALEANGVSWQDAAKESLSRSINVVRPVDAKGLEFDAVVVIEPSDIIGEDDRGHRMLYVALTRSTKRLSVVHSSQPAIPLTRESDESRGELQLLPDHWTNGSDESSDGLPTRSLATSGEASTDNRVIRILAAELADEIRAAITPEQRRRFVQLLAEELEP